MALAKITFTNTFKHSVNLWMKALQASLVRGEFATTKDLEPAAQEYDRKLLEHATNATEPADAIDLEEEVSKSELASAKHERYV